eukprot:m.765731 g.765731  ORF g.765731 m.765731 type:complete len:828 (+) comp23222_c0_seq4:350-2833(+)
MDVTDDNNDDFTQESPGMDLLAGDFSGSVTMNAASPVGFPHFEAAKQAITPRIVGRPTREELKERNILPGGSSHPSLHAAAVSLERAKAADTLNRKIELRPSKEEVVQRNILRDTDAVIVPERQHALNRLQLEKNLNSHFQTRPGVLDLMTHSIIEPPRGLDVRTLIKRENTPVSDLRNGSDDDGANKDEHTNAPVPIHGTRATPLPGAYGGASAPPVPPPLPLGEREASADNMLGLLERSTNRSNGFAAHRTGTDNQRVQHLSLNDASPSASVLRKGKGPSAYQITSPRGFPVFEFDVSSAHAAIMNDFEAQLHHTGDGCGVGDGDNVPTFEDNDNKSFSFPFDFRLEAADRDRDGSSPGANTSWFDEDTQLPLAHGHIVQEQLLSQAKQVDPNLKLPSKKTKTSVPTPLLDIEAHARAKAALHEQLKSSTFTTCDVRQRAQAIQDISQLHAHQQHHHDQQSLWQYQQEQQRKQQHGPQQQTWASNPGPAPVSEWQNSQVETNQRPARQEPSAKDQKFAVPRSGSFGSSSSTRGTSGAGKGSSKTTTTKRPKIKKFTYHDYRGPNEKKPRSSAKTKAKQKQVRVPPPSPNRRLAEQQQAQYLHLQEMQKMYESTQQQQPRPCSAQSAMEDVDDTPQRTLTSGHVERSGPPGTSGHLRGHQRASSWGGGLNDDAVFKSFDAGARTASQAASPLTVNAINVSPRQPLDARRQYSPSNHHLPSSLDSAQRPFSFHGDSPLSAPHHFNRRSPHASSKECHPQPTSSPSLLARGDNGSNTNSSLMMSGLLDASFSDLHDGSSCDLHDLSMLGMDIGDVGDLAASFEFENGA